MRYKHVKTLFHALRTEEPTEILDNFNRLLTGESTKKEAVQSIEELEVVKAQFTAQKKDALAHFLQEGKSLICTRSDQPQVSIILILHNRAELTYSCLLSLLEVSIPTEILIIDNASTDETQELLSLLTGCKSITNPENIGFLRACNQAAQLAKGEHLLFLNNDTQLLPGSLEAAVTTLAADPKIGAVGGSIRLLDGKLQEAGSIIWRDGSCLGYGRGQDPEAPEFMFRRSVDYVSGVFLLTPRELFEAMGGFDEAFLPAYYEETDYCMRLWQQGYQVIYDPEVKVIHYEFASSTKAQDAIALQQTHQQIFVKRHQEMLLQHLIPQAANIISARHAAQRPQKRILFIEDKIPHVNEGSGFPRSNQILNHLHQLGYMLSVLPFSIPHHCPWEKAYRDVDRGIELVQGRGKDDFFAFIKARPQYYDIIWICRPHNLAYFTANMEEIRPLIGDAKIVYDSEAVFSNRDIAKAQLDQDTVQIEALANQLDAELAMGMHADAIIAVNEMEASQFREEVDQPVFVLDASFPIKPSSSQFEQRSGLLFVGNMDHDDSPNVDSIEWLLTEVYPHIAKRMETPRLTLIGSQRSAKIQALARQHACVRQIGQVEDLAPFFARSRVFVAPTRYGAGSPAKALQAATYGLPMVCTDLIQRQLGWVSGEVLLAAPYTAPELFADHICRLYREEELHMRMSTAVVKQVRNAFSSEKQQEMIKEILAAI
jgi:GT2 family glycosyltransferase